MSNSGQTAQSTTLTAHRFQRTFPTVKMHQKMYFPESDKLVTVAAQEGMVP
jgi:hypothetical protein